LREEGGGRKREEEEVYYSYLNIISMLKYVSKSSVI
jgi:hypothetical protein